jgi:prepilin peptidase CpaA
MRLYLNVSAWQFAYGLTLSFFMLIASAEDIRKKRISNTLVFMMLCAGIIFNALEAPTNTLGLPAYHLGPLGAPLALLGSLVGLVMLLPLYLARGLGAGDVKLMAALGSFLGPVDTINLALVILVTGGCAAVVRMVWIDKTRLALSHVAELITLVTNGKPQSFDPSTQSVERMPFVPAMAMGTLIYAGWRWTGGLPFIHF